MIMNALNDIWSDIYILQVNISKNYKSRQKFAKRLGFKDIKFPLKKRILSAFVFLAMKTVKYPI